MLGQVTVTAQCFACYAVVFAGEVLNQPAGHALPGLGLGPSPWVGLGGWPRRACWGRCPGRWTAKVCAQCRLETKSPAGPNPRDPAQSWVLAAIDVSTFEVNWSPYMHARTASVALGSCQGWVGSDQLID